jgi:rhodanese-related sulfurtransferase
MELSKKYLDFVDECKKIIKEISIEETYEIINYKKDILFIDIREESEWTEKRIPKAIYCGKGILEREIESISPNEKTKIILYCGGGYRSAISAKCLMKMGYTNVFSMAGGIGEWEEKGFPVIYN